MKRTLTPATEGDVVIEMSCRCAEAVFVLERKALRWTCGSCHRQGSATGRRFVLGAGGALPAEAEPKGKVA